MKGIVTLVTRSKKDDRVYVKIEVESKDSIFVEETWRKIAKHAEKDADNLLGKEVDL